MTNNTSVIIFGSTGVIGTFLAEYLSKQHPGWKIKAVTRSTANESRLSKLNLPNVTTVAGDPFDKDQVLALCEECQKVYCCIGFHKYETPYWAKHWPLVADNMLAATGSGRQLIFCDNLYAYGHGRDLNEQSPTIKASLKTKPAIRSLLRQKFQDHMKAHPGTVTVIGASDFFGPHCTAAAVAGDIFIGKIVAGESPMALCASNKMHDLCFAPDFAKAMAVASISVKAYDRFWICPHSIHNMTLAEIANAVQKIVTNTDPAKQKANNTPISITVLPAFVLAIASPFMTMMRELYQMRHIWQNDYTFDDSNFCQEFNVQATPYETALIEAVEFYKRQQREQPKK